MFTSKKAFHIFLIQVMAMHFLLANESASQNLADQAQLRDTGRQPQTSVYQTGKYHAVYVWLR